MTVQNGTSIDALPGAVLLIGPDGCVLDLNKAAEDLECSCYRGMRFVNCLDEKDQSELAWRLTDTSVLPENARELEVDGGGRLYRLMLARNCCRDGSRLVQIADITDYRQLSGRVAFNEQRYRSLFSQNPYGVCSLDLQGRISEINSCAEELIGYAKDEFGSSPWDSIVDEQDRNAARQCFEAALEGHSCSYRCRIRDRRGRKAVIVATYIPILVDDEVVGVFCVARDKTERYRLEESQRLLQACMSQIQDVIIITETDPLDPPGPRIVYVNDGVRRMTGYRPEEVLGNTPRMFQGPDTDQAALRRIRKALERRQPVKEVLVNYCKDGVPFWNEVEIVPIPALTTGGRSYFASVQRDITQTKQREAQLRHSQGELRQLTRAQEGVLEQERRRIARDLHDELGQTLTALKLNLGMAVDQMDELSTEHRRHLNNSIESISDAVEKVREISANLRPPMLDDLGFEAAAEWLLSQYAGRDGLDVRWHASPGSKGRVRGEIGTALYRILQECMTNITRHSGASVVTADYREDESTARLEIHDNGRGFDPATAGHYGSGLVGIRERVTMLGGDLMVESAIGKGVRIKVKLPLEHGIDD